MGRVWPGVLLELVRGSCWTPAWENNNGGPNPKENIYLLLSLCALSLTVHQLAKGLFTGSSTSVTKQDQEPISHENIDLEQRGMSHTSSQVSFQKGWEKQCLAFSGFKIHEVVNFLYTGKHFQYQAVKILTSIALSLLAQFTHCFHICYLI